MISWLKFIEKTLVSVLRSRNVASLKGILSYRVARVPSWYAREFWLSVQVFRALLECHRQRRIIFCFFFRLRQRLFWAPLRLDGKFFFHSKVPFILFFSFSFFLPFSFSGARRGARIRERIWTVFKIICLASTRITSKKKEHCSREQFYKSFFAFPSRTVIKEIHEILNWATSGTHFSIDLGGWGWDPSCISRSIAKSKIWI